MGAGSNRSANERRSRAKVAVAIARVSPSRTSRERTKATDRPSRTTSVFTSAGPAVAGAQNVVCSVRSGLPSPACVSIARSRMAAVSPP